MQRLSAAQDGFHRLYGSRGPGGCPAAGINGHMAQGGKGPSSAQTGSLTESDRNAHRQPRDPAACRKEETWD
ncbi:FAD/FMN-containing dehydrogenase [Clostridium sp. SY8519]|nr:FAD/FMN-containing dehydrogenase [Clostridium sp. SY8519]